MKKRTNPRIISGTLKGLRLKSIPGKETRPITDRVKENLFNIIGNDILESSFLDAFAGTGSVGIEAFSRGAEFVLFIEKSKAQYSVLDNNLKCIKDNNVYSIINTDALIFLKTLSSRSFDYIYIAPPQYHHIWQNALKIIDENKDILNGDGWIIVQIDPVEYEYLQFENFSEFDQRKYGNTLLVFYIMITK